MPSWPPHRKPRRSTPSTLQNRTLLSTRTNAFTSNLVPLTPSNNSQPTTPSVSDSGHTLNFYPATTGIGPGLRGSDPFDFSNVHSLNIPSIQVVSENLQSVTDTAPYRSANEPAISSGLLQPQPWANNALGYPMGMGIPALSPSMYAQSTFAPSEGTFSSNFAFGPGLSLEPVSQGSNRLGTPSNLPPLTPISPESRRTQQNISTFAPGHGQSQTAAPLYLAGILNKEIQVTITRENDTRTEATAKLRCNIDHSYIPRPMAIELGLKWRPIHPSKIKPLSTPNGHQIPRAYVLFDVKSEAHDIHNTCLNVLVFEDSSSYLTLGRKALQKVYGSKLEKEQESKAPGDFVIANSMASSAMPQVFDSAMINGSRQANPSIGSAHLSFANTQNTGPVDIQSLLYSSMGAEIGDHSYSAYPSAMPLGGFSGLSSTTGIVTSVSGGHGTFNTGLLNFTGADAIDPNLAALNTAQVSYPSQQDSPGKHPDGHAWRRGKAIQ
ncbi:hypothetical protein GGR52DRAFT_512705 [Hypoxylon sp. FL1284]|nr:hypothetical protein GGR52DRAFT_512705 [Hypoxylon sp. FL1284]